MKTSIFILLISFCIVISGCYTYYPTRENPDAFKTERDEYLRIQKFVLKTDDTVDVNDFDVTFYEKYKNFRNIFYCIESPTQNDNAIFSKGTKKKEKIIQFEQVKTIIVEKRKANTAKTIVAVVGITALSVASILLILIIIIKANSKNIKIG